jgi:uncharacterized membrane protein YccC
MQKKHSPFNGSKKAQATEGLHLFIVLLLIFTALSVFFYLYHLVSNLPIIFAKTSCLVAIFTLCGIFFFLVEITKIKKHE